MFRFADPYFLLLVIPLAVATWFIGQRRARSAVIFSAAARLPERRITWRTLLLPLAPFLFLLGTLLCLLALARPQTFLSRTARHSEAIAIQMLVDCSGSMEALDFSTRDEAKSRLQVVKDTFARFIARRPDDLIGLTTFAGYASSRAPLTLDHSALLHVLKGVEVPGNILDSNGRLINEEEMLTAIGDGLATACGRLEHAQVKSRIIVLLSDGESNTGLIKPDDAARMAKTMGIKIYTIGIGSTGTAPILVRDRFGRSMVQYAEVRLDEDQLRRIAAKTGGRYFNVRDPQGLERALEDINKLEKTRIDTTVYNQYREWMAWFLVPGIALILLGAGIQIWLRGETI